jgi:hypothetical protein
MPDLKYRDCCESEVIYSGQRRGSVTFWCGSESADPYLRLIDPAPAPFFSDFMDGKKKFYLIFSHNLPTGTLFSLLNFKLLKLYFASIRKGKDPDMRKRMYPDPEPDPDPYL